MSDEWVIRDPPEIAEYLAQHELTEADVETVYLLWVEQEPESPLIGVVCRNTEGRVLTLVYPESAKSEILGPVLGGAEAFSPNMIDDSQPVVVKEMPRDFEGLPIDLSGTGREVVHFNVTEQCEVRIRYRQDGPGEFTLNVSPPPPEQDRREELASAKGPSIVEFTVVIPSPRHVLIEVESEGAWSLDIQRAT